MPRFCVVIPTYNEADTIVEVIEGVEEAGASGVVVVDNRSGDKTVKIIRRLKEFYNNPVCLSPMLRPNLRAHNDQKLVSIAIKGRPECVSRGV